jgi:tRNA(Arg) A34 adenosine deaminase TadA
VDAAGNVLLEGQNTIVTEGDPTGHAEINLVRRIGRLNPALLVGATLYASTEPCAMCAGALYWGNVARLVFGLSNARLYREILSDSGDALGLDCRSVLGAGARRVEVRGPLVEDEAATIVAEWADRRPARG